MNPAATRLHLCWTSLYPVAFHLFPGNSHGAPTGRKFIESIYPKNNSYLLVDRAYEDDKTIALAKAHGFHPVVHSKKNRKFLGYAINSFINNEILLNDISFV